MDELTCEHCGEIIGAGESEADAVDAAIDGGAGYNDLGELVCGDCHIAGDLADTLIARYGIGATSARADSH